MTCTPEIIYDIIDPPPGTGPNRTFRQATAPVNPGDALVIGDLWFDTSTGSRESRWDGTTWVDVTDSRIALDAANLATEAAARIAADTSLAMTDADLALADSALQENINAEAATREAEDMALSDRIDNAIIGAGGGGSRTFYQASAPANPGDMLLPGDLWFDSDDGKKLSRWSGSAWVEVTDQRLLDATSNILSVISQITDPVTGLVAVSASVSQEATARTTADSALATLIAVVQAMLNDPTTGLAAAFAAVTNEATARASAVSAEAIARLTVEASLTGQLQVRPNILFNGGFELGFRGWAFTGVASLAPVGKTYSGFGQAMHWIAQGTSLIYNIDLFPITAGKNYVLTGDMLGAGTSGTLRFIVNWYTSLGVLVSQSVLGSVNLPFTFVEGNANRNTLARQVTAPATATQARVLFQCLTGVGITDIAVRQIKMEQGVLPPTPYTAEGALLASDVAVTEEAIARANADGTIFAQWGVTIDSNNRIIGSVRLDGNASNSDFVVVANKFKIVDPSNALVPVAVFTLITTAGIRRLILGAPQQSTNYVQNNAGYWIDSATGNAEFNRVVLRDPVIYLNQVAPTFTNDYGGAVMTSRSYTDSDQISIRAHTGLINTRIRQEINKRVSVNSPFWPTHVAPFLLPGTGPDDFLGIVQSDGTPGNAYQHTTSFHACVATDPTGLGLWDKLGPEAICILTWVPPDMTLWPQVASPYFYFVAGTKGGAYTVAADDPDAAATMYKSTDGVNFSLYTPGTSIVMAAGAIVYVQARRGDGYRDSPVIPFANTGSGLPNNSPGNHGSGGSGTPRNLP
ncbi:MAG: hypothetical protein ABI162_07105 [Luteolibacter sp.]